MNNPTKYPMPAWRVFGDVGRSVTAHLVMVTAVQGKSAAYRYRPCAGLPEIVSSCPVTELASTREKALAKIDSLLTALESRAPQTNVAVKTDSGAAVPQPQPTPPTPATP